MLYECCLAWATLALTQLWSGLMVSPMELSQGVACRLAGLSLAEEASRGSPS